MDDRQNKTIILEKSLLEIFDFIAAKNNQKFEKNVVFLDRREGKRIFFDGYAENGIGDLEGAIYVEIGLISRNANNYIKEICEYANFTGEARLLFITSNLATQDYRHDNNVIIWNVQNLYDFASRFDYSISKIADFTSKLSDKYGFIESDDIREILLWKIKENMTNFTFVLGAGVSKNYGLPNWGELLDNLVKIDNKTINVESVQKQIGETDIIKAQLILELHEARLGKLMKGAAKLRLASRIQNLFYKGFIEPQESIIKDLAKVLQINRDISVVTYNYDDILEYELGRLNEPCQTIFYNQKIQRDKTTIYHPHGFIPKNTLVNNDIAKSIVLSEGSYNYLYNNPFSWPNLIQLTKFRETICIFIGVSIKDPSVRRLLELSIDNTTKENHYAFLRKDNLSDIEISTINQHFARLNIKIIWILDFYEINNFLRKLQ